MLSPFTHAGGLTTGQLVGIIVGSIIGFFILITIPTFILICICLKHKAACPSTSTSGNVMAFDVPATFNAPAACHVPAACYVPAHISTCS